MLGRKGDQIEIFVEFVWVLPNMRLAWCMMHAKVYKPQHVFLAWFFR